MKPGQRDGEGRWSLNDMFDLFSNLRERADVEASVLSGGEKQMLTICRTLMGDPSVVMIDEPTEGLAPKIVSYVYEFLRNSQERGITILLVDQNINQAIENSEYLYMLEMGTVAMQGSAHMFKENLKDIIRESLLGA